MDALAVWYAHAAMDRLEAIAATRLGGRQRKALARSIAKARTKDNLGALGRFASVDDGSPRLKAEPPLVVPIRDLVGSAAELKKLDQSLRQILHAYAETLDPERRVLLDRYRLVDMARKVVGVGSVGTRSWMMLMLEDGTNPLFLQAKEAGPSVLEAYAGASTFENSGQRVVVGQRLMQAVGDIFLGYVRVKGIDGQSRDFYVRQLRDWKGSAEVETMVPAGMQAYGRDLRMDPRPGPCPFGGPHRAGGLSRRELGLRRRHSRVRRGLCRSERAGSRLAARRHPVRSDHRGVGRVAAGRVRGALTLPSRVAPTSSNTAHRYRDRQKRSVGCPTSR